MAFLISVYDHNALNIHMAFLISVYDHNALNIHMAFLISVYDQSILTKLNVVLSFPINK